jgi:hypothetical protein
MNLTYNNSKRNLRNIKRRENERDAQRLRRFLSKNLDASLEDFEKYEKVHFPVIDNKNKMPKA